MRTGILAGVVYATTLTPYVGATIVTPDTLLVLWQAIAVWAFFRAGRATQATARWGWPALCGAAFGLAFLTKGPPGLLFLPAMFLARRLYRHRLPGAAPVLNVTGVLALVVIGLSWYAAVLARNPETLEYWLKEDVVGRVAGQHHRNAGWFGAFAIHLPTLTLGALPWMLAWPVLRRRARRRRGGLPWMTLLAERPVAGSLPLLFVVPLLVFSVSRSRLPLYVQPLFVPLALATGRAIALLAASPTDIPVLLVPRTWRLKLAAWSVLLVAARLIYAWYPGDADARRLYTALPRAADTHIIAVDGCRYFGLEFYAARDVVHADTAGEPTLDEMIATAATSVDTPHVFLVRTQDCRDLETRLRAAGATVVDTQDAPRRIVVLASGHVTGLNAGSVATIPSTSGLGTPAGVDATAH